MSSSPQGPIFCSTLVGRSAVLDVVFLFNGIADENTRKTTSGDNPVVMLNSLELDGHLDTTVCYLKYSFCEEDGFAIYNHI